MLMKNNSNFVTTALKKIEHFMKPRFLGHLTLIFTYLVTFYFQDNFIIALLHATSGILLFFYVVGNSFKGFLKRFLATPVGNYFSEIALEVLLSITIFIIVSILLSIGFLLNFYNLSLALILVVIICDISALDFFKFRTQTNDIITKNQKTLDLKVYILALIPVFFGIFLVMLFRSGFSWPSMPGWDLYAYLGGSNWIFQNHGLSLSTLWPTNSGSIIPPNSYIFQIIVCAISYLTGTSPYVVFWSAPFATIPLFGFLVFCTVFSLFKNSNYAIFTSLITLSISGGDIFLGPQYFFPSTLSIIIFLLIITFLVSFENLNKLYFILALLFISIFVALYYFPIIVTFPLLFFFLLRDILLKKWSQKLSLLVLGILIVLMISFSWIGSSLLGGGILSISQKFNMLNSVYSPILFFLFALGSLIITLKLLDNSLKDKTLVFMLAYSLSLLVIFFLPPFSSVRLEIFLRFVFAIIASFPIILVIESFFSERSTKNILRKIGHFGNHTPLLFSILFMCLIIMFSIQPYISYAESVPSFSNISSDELSAGKWIEANTPKSTYILSDPSSGYVLRGLTTRNISSSFIIDGHTPSSINQTNLVNIIWDFFRETDLSILSAYYNELPQKPEFIVITTRTVSWINSQSINSSFLVPMGSQLTEFKGDQKFSTPFFVLLKSWPTVEIFKTVNATIDRVWFDTSFSIGSSWYLDGDYGSHNNQINSGITNLNVQANSSENAWMGLTKLLPNVSQATFLKIRFKIDIPSYTLEFVLWQTNQSWIINNLEQTTNWTEVTFPLTKQVATNLNKIGFIIWTQDQDVHNLEIDYVLLGVYSS